MRSIAFSIFGTTGLELRQKICQEFLKSRLPVRTAEHIRHLREWGYIYAVHFVIVWGIE